jgi:hypothetical protein
LSELIKEEKAFGLSHIIQRARVSREEFEKYKYRNN